MSSENESLQEEEIRNNEEDNTEVVENNETQESNLESELKEEKDKFIRLYAEFDNFKKRSQKEKVDLIKYGSQEILSALLPVVDDFERAIKELEKNDNREVLEGVLLIQNKFLKTLEEKGLKKMEVNIGDAFNSDKHEAVTQIPAPEESLKGKIVDVIETGYLLQDRIIRYAKVIVGN
ncbi:MAG: nucleotide exchange factor GrpE [Flavobacteriales bacterium]|nr:nucleotide exchange factor GrpE [Flavobacteriales bacterium]